MKRCKHIFRDWSHLFEGKVTRPAGSFGETYTTIVMFQSRSCKLCNYIESREAVEGQKVKK